MAGPTPAVAATRLAVRTALAGVGDDVVVGCSGGADSVALAAAVAFETRGAARLVTVDHGLQPGSAARAADVVALAGRLGFAVAEAVRVDVGTAGGPENAARVARYAALERYGRPVLLGHTMDDQAETVLLALGRGSGPGALTGMASTATRVRPFLGLRRGVTRAACADLGLPVWDDPHNDDPRFRRVRVRHELLPLLDDVLGGGVVEALARTADLVRADDDLLALLAGEHERDDDVVLASLPAALRTRVLRRRLRTAGAGPLTAAHVAAVDRLLTAWHGQGPVSLPGGVAVQRVSGRLTVVRTSPPEEG